jgi:hypothetical protein
MTKPFRFNQAIVERIVKKMERIIADALPCGDFKTVMLIAIRNEDDEEIELAICSNAGDTLTNELLERALGARTNRDRMNEFKITLAAVCTLIGMTPDDLVDAIMKGAEDHVGNA